MEEPGGAIPKTRDPTEGRGSGSARDQANIPDHGLRGVGDEDNGSHENETSLDGGCPYPCPICAGVGLFRQLNPEIGEHLSAAAKEFLLAAKAFFESVAEGSHKKETEPVERIPFD